MSKTGVDTDKVPQNRSTQQRRYWSSSSFIMALTFCCLLGTACIFLAYVIQTFSVALEDPDGLTGTSTRHQFLFYASIVVLLTMLLVIIVSFLISIFVVDRINKISSTADQIIETGDMSQRISLNSTWDDLGFLAVGINRLLDRIQLLMQGVEDVSDNIAHDMRTPLTRLRNRLEAVDKSEISAKEREQLIQETDNILTTFNTVMRISRLSLSDDIKMDRVNATEVLRDVIELYGPVAEEKGSEIFLSGTGTVQGDPNLLFQLFANLIDNAVKFSPADSAIDVKIAETQGFVTISIRDKGVGIDDDEKERITERFYRGDTSRNTPGSGLGLAMAVAIVKRHKARMSFNQAKPGLEVMIDIPRF